MSGIVAGGGNKKRYALALSIGAAISVFRTEIDFSNIDWETLLAGQALETGALALFIATILYLSRIDSGLDLLLKWRSRKGYWIKRESRKQSELLSFTAARIAVLTAPWSTQNWKSYDNDIRKAIEEVLEDGIAYDILWGVKLSISTGIAGILVVSKFLSSNTDPLILILGVVAALALILFPLSHKEMRILPRVTQALAIYRILKNAAEATIPRFSGKKPKDARSTSLNNWIQAIQADATNIASIAEQQRWGLLEDRLNVTLQRFEGYLVHQDFQNGLDREIANSIIRAYTDMGGFAYPRTMRKSDFVLFFNSIRKTFLKAYNKVIPAQLVPILGVELTTDDPFYVIERIPYQYLDTQTVSVFATVFQREQYQLNDRLGKSICAHWATASLTDIILNPLFNHANTSVSYSFISKSSEHYSIHSLILAKVPHLINPILVTDNFVDHLINLADKDLRDIAIPPVPITQLQDRLLEITKNGSEDAQLRIIKSWKFLKENEIPQIMNYIRNTDPDNVDEFIRDRFRTTKNEIGPA